MATEKKVVLFNFKNETKGTFRYEEVSDDGDVKNGDNDNAVIGALYLRKKQYPKGAPQKIKVVIEAT